MPGLTWRSLWLWVIALVALPNTARAEDPIRLWHAYRGAEEAALLEILEDAPGPPVKVLSIPHDAFGSKLAAAIGLGEGPDLFIDSHERLGDYQRRGLVAPVGDALEPSVFDARALEAVTLGGHAFGVPLSRKSLALYVNRTLVDGPPAALDELFALVGTLRGDAVPLAYEAMSPYSHAPILHGFGGVLLAPDDNFGFVGAQAEASVEFVQRLLEAGVVPPDADGALVTDLFRAGRAAYAISGPWLASDLQERGGTQFEFSVELLPPVSSGGKPMQPLLTVEAVMLSPSGAERVEVRRLAQHLGSAPAANVRQRVAQTLTARTDVDPDGSRLIAFAQQAQTAIVMPTSAAMRLTWEPARQALRKCLRGQASPADALGEAQRRFADVSRPPPPPASPWPGFLVVGFLSLWGAVVLVRRSRRAALGPALRASLPAYRYVAHAVIAVGVLVVAPLVVGAATSVFAGPGHDMHYVGLANFVEILTARGRPLLSSGSFYLVLLVTVLWTVVNVALHLGIGLSVGLLLTRPNLRFKAIYRVLLIVPWAVPNYVTALAWKGMFHRQFGAVTGLIQGLNELLGTSMEPISWFAQFSTAFTANVATNVWLGFPFMMVVTIGALTAVPKDVLEAAEVDGASRWQRLWRVTLPIIRPSLMPAVTLGAIWTFNMFNVVFLVSGGDPDGTTDILVSEAYRWAFTREAQYGYAAAYAVLIFVLLLGGTRLLERFEARWSGSGRGDAS